MSYRGLVIFQGVSIEKTYENSVSDLVERIKAGAVIVDRSPLKDAMDYFHVSQLDAVIEKPCASEVTVALAWRKQLCTREHGGRASYLEEARPRALCLGRHR
jgi:hypothetical protein